MSFKQPAPLCADLDAIVREALRLGNVLASGPFHEHSGWFDCVSG